MEKVTAIFDIGKTNKKFFLFNNSYEIVHSSNIEFALIEDEDGYPCDDLEAITQWVKNTFLIALESTKYNIHSLNFSTHGASLVHIDKNEKPLTSLYNYTKEIDQHYIDKLYAKHGGSKDISTQTGSPPSGMLNSGVQLFWLKYHRPHIFKQIEYSLHLPQYMSYLFTNIPTSDFTSLGCHTMMWDYKKQDYHDWVKSEKIDKKLAPIEKSNKTFNVNIKGKNVKIGIGIHDSSSALVPYFKLEKRPFLLVSTGTWVVTLNPFYDQELNDEDLKLNCLNYMNTDGKAVRASRLFLGNEYKIQVSKLNAYFKKDNYYHKAIAYSSELYQEIKNENLSIFKIDLINDYKSKNDNESAFHQFTNYDHAYHQMVFELIKILKSSVLLAKGNTDLNTIYVDGGFVANKVFMKLLFHNFMDYTIMTASSAQGSALGAALIIKNDLVFLEKLGTQVNLSKIN